jgi:hypothetical protein
MGRRSRMKVKIRDNRGEYVIPDVDEIEEYSKTTTLRIGRDTLYVASADIVEVDTRR